MDGADTIKVSTYIDTLPNLTDTTDFVNKYWNIEVNDEITILDGRLNFYYDDSELNDIDASSVIIQRSLAKSWQSYITECDTTNNILSCIFNNINELRGIWTIYKNPIYVPQNYTTIQAALNAADSGDVVLVAAGTYQENIIWPEVNGIRLISESGSANTIIESNSKGNSIIKISPTIANIDSTTSIEGFTIKNSETDLEGAIHIAIAAPLLKGNVITDNTFNQNGAGIFCDNASPIIDNNTITNNKILDNINGFGGGIICINNSSPIIIRNNIDSNSGGKDGGGIYSNNSSPIFGGDSIFTNKIYHNSPNSYYSDSGKGILVATHNYWGTSDSLAIEQSFGGLDTLYYIPFVGEPTPNVQYVAPSTDTTTITMRFAEVVIKVAHITGRGRIIIKTFIARLPIWFKSDTTFVNKYWEIEKDESIITINGELFFYYDDTEVTSEIEFSLQNSGGLIRWDGNQKHYYEAIIDTTNNFAKISMPDEIEGTWVLAEPIVGIQEEENNLSIITKYALMQNYPNPFNPITTIKYQLPESNIKVHLNIYNIKGQLVRTLVNEIQNVGIHSIIWDGKNNDGRDLSSGIYLYRLKTEKYINTKKMLLLK